MLSNAEIAAVLDELATLTVLEDGSAQSFRVRAYEKAARAAALHDRPLAAMSAAEIAGVPGLGAGSARKIRELADTGRLARLDELRDRFPPAFVEVTRIPGVGPKTALLLRDRLGIGSVADLRAAIDAQALRQLPGLGAKTEENLARSLERLGIAGRDRRTPIADAMRIAGDVVAALEMVEGVERATPMGSLRRFRETIGDIDVIAVADGATGAVMQRFTEMPVVRDVVASGARKSAVVVGGGVQVDLRVVRPDQFGAAAVYFTGSKSHNIRLRQRAIERGWTLNEYALADAGSGSVVASASEAEIYAALDLPWIPPELREDSGEFEAALAGTLPDLVAVEHLRGDLHVHTDLSGDGRESLERMLTAAAERGLEYVAITDHAEDLAINGATRRDMLEQRSRLAALRGRWPSLTVLHGVELNIGRDGTVDYDPEFLAGFDFGVASVHSLFDLDRATQTRRIVTAMEHPAVNVIGHLSGRMIGRRPGIDLDIDEVLAAAESTGCALEINGHLDRLDASSEVVRRSRGSKVVFAISSDAHDVSELGTVGWGVANARRGWLERDRVVNTWPERRFLDWVGDGRRH